MEGENKDMKMKKLTALALAGVLCLGMSTTAFASASPLPEDAVTATNDAGKEVEVTQNPIRTDSGTFADWNSKKPEKVDSSVRETLEDRLIDISKIMRDEDKLSQEDVKKLNEEKKALEDLMSTTDQFVVGALMDVKAPGTTVDDENPLKIKFELTGAWEGVANEKTVNLLHAITDEYGNIVAWEVFKNVPIQKDEKGVLYVEQEFESLSPVAILRVPGGDDTKPGTNPGDQPGTNPGDQPTLTPDANGNITADQLADLIVKKLQQSADTKVIRVASGKASPKTGE